MSSGVNSLIDRLNHVGGVEEKGVEHPQEGGGDLPKVGSDDHRQVRLANTTVQVFEKKMQDAIQKGDTNGKKKQNLQSA